MMALRWLCLGLLVALGACEGSSSTGSTPAKDSVAVETQAEDTVAVDTAVTDDVALVEVTGSDTLPLDDVSVVDTNQLTDTGELTDASATCPADLSSLDGTPCTSEGLTCGKCTDPCQFCNIWRCESGLWSHLEAFPDPNCGDAGDSDTSSGDTEDPCARVGCSMPPMCDEGCQAPCGCCFCAEGEATCVTGTAGDSVRSCSSNGCYVESACASGDLCVAAGEAGTGCVQGFGSCIDVELAYAFFTDDAHQACETDADCQILNGHCGVGVGGCYELVNKSTSEAVLGALAGRFAALDCTTAVCDCAAPPASVVCTNKKCVAGP